MENDLKSMLDYKDESHFDFESTSKNSSLETKYLYTFL